MCLKRTKCFKVWKTKTVMSSAECRGTEGKDRVELKEEEDAYEESEFIVELKFERSNVLHDMSQRPEVLFKVLGITTEQPVLQLDDQIFVGRYFHAGGTRLIFEEGPPDQSRDPIFSPNPGKSLHYICSTRKVLYMSRVFVNSVKTGESLRKAFYHNRKKVTYLNRSKSNWRKLYQLGVIAHDSLKVPDVENDDDWISDED